MLAGLVVLALHPLSCANADRTAAARLSAESGENDPAFVYEKVRGSFYVENIGGDPFRIADVKSTCACTTALRTKGAVAPGERVEIQYDMGSAAAKKRSVAIFVQTNPPLAEPLRFTATGTWKPVLDMDADALEIETRFGEPFEHVIPLRAAPGANPIRLTGAKTRQSWAELALRDAEDGELPSLVVRSKGVIQPGTHKLGIAVEFQRSEPGRQDMTLNVHVRSEFTVAPSPLIVEFTSGQPIPTAELTIRNEEGKPFVPKSIRAERFRIRRPELPVEPASVHIVPIVFDLEAGPPPRRGRLLVDLGDSNGVLTVDVFFSDLPGRG